MGFLPYLFFGLALLSSVASFLARQASAAAGLGTDGIAGSGVMFTRVAWVLVLLGIAVVVINRYTGGSEDEPENSAES